MKKLIVIPIAIFLLLFILFHTVFLIGIVPSASMEPALNEGSLILCTRVCREYRKGDIIVFDHDELLLVKRIAACGGESVTVGGRIETVPDGCFYVLGDNPDDSIDSRYWENPFISASDIRAKVIFPKEDKTLWTSRGLPIGHFVGKNSPFSLDIDRVKIVSSNIAPG